MHSIQRSVLSGTWSASISEVLKTIYYRGPITRSEIADLLGLTRATITTNVNYLIAAGLVKEDENPVLDSNSLGRKARRISIIPDAKHYVGIEIRGFKRTISVRNLMGKTIYSNQDNQLFTGYDENVKVGCSMLQDALDACGFTLNDISGIGFCMPGVVNHENGVLDTLPSFGWRDKPVRDDVRALTGFNGPICIENNACARAYGLRLTKRELLKDIHNFTYFFISRGIACPLFLDTNNVVGSVVGAGEIGHMIMQPNGLLCSCGNRGCLEAYSSDTAVISRCQEAMDHDQAVLLRALCHGEPPTMQNIISAQMAGDEDVRRIVERAVNMLGLAMANVVNFASSHIMFIDGVLFGVPENREQLLNVIHTNLCNALHPGTEFRFVEPDDYSGANGAAALAIHYSLSYGAF